MTSYLLRGALVARQRAKKGGKKILWREYEISLIVLPCDTPTRSSPRTLGRAAARAEEGKNIPWHDCLAANVLCSHGALGDQPFQQLGTGLDVADPRRLVTHFTLDRQ